jgi:hypothetical protein
MSMESIMRALHESAETDEQVCRHRSEARRHEALTLAISNNKGLRCAFQIEEAKLIEAYLRGDETVCGNRQG